MKILNKIIIPLSVINVIMLMISPLMSGYFQIATALLSIITISFFYYDGLDFCRKLEKAAKGKKVKF